MKDTVIELRNVSFAYNGQAVLQAVNMVVGQRDFVAMIGPNGGGKTTLLKLMLGLLKPQRGDIRLFGRPAERASHAVGYVPQDVHINRRFPITAMDVVLMGKLQPKRRWGKSIDQDRTEALDALERMGIGDLAANRIGELSGGQLQRVFIARALVTRPRLLLLDEPTASIDTRGQAEFFMLLKELNREITVVVVSHDLLVISRFAKSVACVNKHVHHHHKAEITGDMMETMYPCAEGETCPVEIVAHGLPHRVLKNHGEARHD